MGAQHTPGPWIFYADVPSTDPNWHIVTTENKLRVLANVHIEPGNQVDEANARLISAAPDLLAAIREFMPKGVDTGNPNVPDETIIPLDVTMGELRTFAAAIAKALGQDAEGVS